MHPDVYKNINALSLMDAFELRAFIIHKMKLEKDSPLMAELITALEKHIQKVGNV